MLHKTSTKKRRKVHKMTKPEGLEDLVNKMETHCYTYEVNMIIQVFARSEEEAKEKLDREGGYISKRVVELKDAVRLYSGELNDSTETKKD
jgi:hypothetical protein